MSDYASDRSFVEQLARFEREAPINELQVGDIHVWPLLRWMIVDRSRAHLKGPQSSDKKFLGLGRFLAFPVRTTTTMLKQPASFRWALRDLLKQTRRPIDVLSVSLVSGKMQTIDGRAFSKFSDALAEILGDEVRVVDGDLFFHNAEAYGNRLHPPRFLDATVGRAWAHQRMAGLFSRAGQPTTAFLEVYEKLEQGAARFDALDLPDAQALWLRAGFIATLRPLIEKKLRKLNVRVIMLGGYYHDIGMAMCEAGRELGIPVVELQHGQQGPFHPMYTHWTHIPETGYAWLPSQFWTWGEPSRAVIAASMDDSNAHRVFIGGHPWLAYRSSTQKTERPPAHDAPTTVLIALQPIDDFLPASLLEAMAQARDIAWLIRPHPSMRDKLEPIHSTLEQAGIPSGNLEANLQADLYSQLAQVDVNITCWSSVAYEALCFDTPSLIVHPNGRDIMRTYIERGYFRYADSAEEILRVIREQSFEPVAVEDAYIQASPDLIRASVATLLGETSRS